MPSHLLLSTDELHDVLVDALRVYEIARRRDTLPQPAAAIAIAVATANIRDDYAARSRGEFAARLHPGGAA